MGIIIPPSLLPLQSAIPGKAQRNVVRFGYDFSTDTPAPQNLGGYSFIGSVYELNVSSIRNLYAVLNPFKSLQFVQTYKNETVDQSDGQLIIYVESTGQMMFFGIDPTIGGSTSAGAASVTAAIPIVSAMPTIISFGKEQASSGGALTGKIRATLFDFDLSPYVTTGVCANL